MADQASTDPATEKLKNLNIQDYDSSAASFDPFAPQGVIDTMQQDMDLLGGAGNFQMDNNLSNGHGGAKNVSFDDVAFGLPDPGFVKSDNQGQGPANARNMSSSELLGFQSDYGNNLNTGQMEYTCVSDDDENNLLDLDNAEGEDIPVTGCHGDQDYYMSTGQPLVELGIEGQPMDEVVGGEYDEDHTAAANQTSHGVPDIVQINNQPENYGREEHFYDGYYQDNEELEGNVLDPGHLHPQADPERMRRSLSPERSLSPDHSRDAESASSFEQQCDNGNTGTECANFQRIQNDSETEHELNKTELPKRTKPSGIPSKCMSPARSEDSDTPGDNKPLPKHRMGQIPILQPSPKLKKRPLELPPWNDNVIVPVLPRARPTLIGKQSDVVSPTPRPKTAPIRHSVKDASSDSGVEEDRSNDVRRKYYQVSGMFCCMKSHKRRRCLCRLKSEVDIDSASCWDYEVDCGNVNVFPDCGDCSGECPPCCLAMCDCLYCLMPGARWPRKHRRSSTDSRRKYGTDTKNQTYKPGGGNVKIFNEKIDTRNVGPRTDCTKPRTVVSPRGSQSSLKSPVPNKPPSPGLKNVSSKFGSLNNTRHSPGGGNVTILSQQKDYSNVSSRTTSKTDHKPKGGDKKIEVKKLEWKAESKVGSLKNTAHSPGGGNIKEYEGDDENAERRYRETLKPHVDTRENIGYTPGGGNVTEAFDDDLDWDADAKIHSLDNVDYQPGGGRVKIFSEKLNWRAEAKVDTNIHAKPAQKGRDSSPTRYSSSKKPLILDINPLKDSYNVMLKPSTIQKFKETLQTESPLLLEENGRINNKTTFMEAVPITNSRSSLVVKMEKIPDAYLDELATANQLSMERPNNEPNASSMTVNVKAYVNEAYIDDQDAMVHVDSGIKAKDNLNAADDANLFRTTVDDAPSKPPRANSSAVPLGLASNMLKTTQIPNENEIEVIHVADIKDYAEIGTGTKSKKKFGKLATILIKGTGTKTSRTSMKKSTNKCQRMEKSQNANDAQDSNGNKKAKASIASKIKEFINKKSEKNVFKSKDAVIYLLQSDIEDTDNKNNMKGAVKSGQSKENIEKIASLGYNSPKLAKKGKNVTLTGLKKEYDMLGKCVDKNISLSVIGKVDTIRYDCPKMLKNGYGLQIPGNSEEQKHGDYDDVHIPVESETERVEVKLINVAELDTDGFQSSTRVLRDISNIEDVKNRETGILSVATSESYFAPVSTGVVATKELDQCAISNGKGSFASDKYNSGYAEVSEISNKSDGDNFYTGTGDYATIDKFNIRKGLGVASENMLSSLGVFNSNGNDRELVEACLEDNSCVKINLIPGVDDDNLGNNAKITASMEELSDIMTGYFSEWDDESHLRPRSLSPSQTTTYRYSFNRKQPNIPVDEIKQKLLVDTELIDKHIEESLEQPTHPPLIATKTMQNDSWVSDNELGKTSLSNCSVESRHTTTSDQEIHDMVSRTMSEEKIQSKNISLVFIPDHENKSPDIIEISGKDNGNKGTEEVHSDNIDNALADKIYVSMAFGAEKQQKSIFQIHKEKTVSPKPESPSFVFEKSKTDASLQNVEQTPRMGTPSSKFKKLQNKIAQALGTEVSRTVQYERNKSAESTLLYDFQTSDTSQQIIPEVVVTQDISSCNYQTTVESVVPEIKANEATVKVFPAVDHVVIHDSGTSPIPFGKLSAKSSMTTISATTEETQTVHDQSAEIYKDIPEMVFPNTDDFGECETILYHPGTLELTDEESDGDEASCEKILPSAFRDVLTQLEASYSDTGSALERIAEQDEWLDVAVDKHEYTSNSEPYWFSDIGHMQMTDEPSNIEDQCVEKFYSEKEGTTDEIEAKHPTEQMITDQRRSWSARSRIGSLDNAQHSPGGGKVKVYDQKVEVKAQPKVGSTANIRHKPGGGEKKIETQKLEFKEKAAPKVGSLDKVKHQPGGGDIKIETQKLEFKEKAAPKVGSLDKVTYQPGGGDIKVIDEKVAWTAASRIGSLENAKHVPGGGHVKVIDDKVSWTTGSRIGSLDNARHVPGGGHVKVYDEKLFWDTSAKVRSFSNVNHTPLGGNLKILDEKVDFSTAQPKVGSLVKADHQPGGGDKKVGRSVIIPTETVQRNGYGAY